MAIEITGLRMGGTTRDQPLLTVITRDMIHDIIVIVATTAQIDGGMIQVAQGPSVEMIMPGLLCKDQFNDRNRFSDPSSLALLRQEEMNQVTRNIRMACVL